MMPPRSKKVKPDTIGDCYVCRQPITIEEATVQGYVQDSGSSQGSLRHVACLPDSNKSEGRIIKYIPPVVIAGENNPIKSANQITKQYRVGQKTIYGAIARGKFPASWLGSGWLIDTRHEAFQAWIESVKAYAVKHNRVEVLEKARAAKER